MHARRRRWRPTSQSSLLAQRRKTAGGLSQLRPLRPSLLRARAVAQGRGAPPEHAAVIPRDTGAAPEELRAAPRPGLGRFTTWGCSPFRPRALTGHVGARIFQRGAVARRQTPLPRVDEELLGAVSAAGGTLADADHAMVRVHGAAPPAASRRSAAGALASARFPPPEPGSDSCLPRGTRARVGAPPLVSGPAPALSSSNP